MGINRTQIYNYTLDDCASLKQVRCYFEFSDVHWRVSERCGSNNEFSIRFEKTLLERTEYQNTGGIICVIYSFIFTETKKLKS